MYHTCFGFMLFYNKMYERMDPHRAESDIVRIFSVPNI
jgi:hypothetical protein